MIREAFKVFDALGMIFDVADIVAQLPVLVCLTLVLLIVAWLKPPLPYGRGSVTQRTEGLNG